MENCSGIYPLGDRVLIKPEEVGEEVQGDTVRKATKDGLIVIPKQVSDQYGLAQSIGCVVAIGPDAWIDHVEFNADGSRKGSVGFTSKQANVGDRVSYAKYSGNQLVGSDGKIYRLMRDKDLSARVDEAVDFTELNVRKAFALQEQ